MFAPRLESGFWGQTPTRLLVRKEAKFLWVPPGSVKRRDTQSYGPAKWHSQCRTPTISNSWTLLPNAHMCSVFPFLWVLNSQETFGGECLCSVVEGNGWDGWRDAFCLFAQLLYCWTTFEWNLFLLQEILLDGKLPFYSTTQSVGCVHVCAYGGGGIWEKLPGRQSWRFSAFCQAKESLTFVGFSLSKIVSNFSG